MRLGLSGRTAVGRVGGYRTGIWTEVVQVGSCIARGSEFFTPGDRPVPLLSVDLPPDCRREHLGSSWTGRSIRFTWADGRLDLHLRCTLPGPLFANFGRRLRLRFAFGNAPERVVDLQSGRNLSPFVQKDLGAVVVLLGGRRPAVLACSEPVKRLTVVTHEHMEVEFDSDTARVIWVPLFGESDLPTIFRTAELWQRLAAAPPVECEEHYELRGSRVCIRQEFFSPDGGPSALAPLPPVAALLGRRGDLQLLPDGTDMCRTLLGPYRVVEGSSFEWSIDTRWTQAKVVPRRKVEGALAAGLSPIPEELVYAGDATWEPGTPMDQCLALRVWGQLAGVMPTDLWEKLKPALTPPTPEQFRSSLMIITEPFTGQQWAKDARLFPHRGDISYDSDWYNGLTLSGMWRGMRCADGDIARACRALARACKYERRLLYNYMWIFHDWALCCSWTDPRGETWNLDCSHNGLEGVLAEFHMRKDEGDEAGAEEALYLAAKMGVAFVAAFRLADWCRQVGFVRSDAGDPHLGIADLREWRGAVIDGPSTKRPYGLAGNFPEFACLLRMHGPMERFRQVAELWKLCYPERYEDWEIFYTGGTRTAAKTLRQEEREQAAVMYHVAPEIALRLWILREDPDEVERLYKRPPSLAEQLWCRCAAVVQAPDGRSV